MRGWLVFLMMTATVAAAAFFGTKGFFGPEEAREKKWEAYENRNRRDKR